jgi:hypothetical protein
MMDHANTFGKGKSATSKLLYFYSLSIALDCISNDIPSGIVYDLGGGNGLSKRWFDNNEVLDHREENLRFGLQTIQPCVTNAVSPWLSLLEEE